MSIKELWFNQKPNQTKHGRAETQRIAEVYKRNDGKKRDGNCDQ